MARREKKYHYIYKITNVLNDKYYIGLHSTDDLDDGYFGSGKKLVKSIKRYGKENFKKEILEFLSNRSSLIEREEEIINEDLLKDLLCMNVVMGGNFVPYEACRRGGLTATKNGWKKGKYKIRRGKDASFFGKHHTKEYKKMIGLVNSIKQKGKGNSQYGRCWITNGKENRKVKNKNVVLENSWHYGRTVQHEATGKFAVLSKLTVIRNGN
jgi:hypothetical protein